MTGYVDAENQKFQIAHGPLIRISGFLMVLQAGLLFTSGRFSGKTEPRKMLQFC